MIPALPFDVRPDAACLSGEHIGRLVPREALLRRGRLGRLGLLLLIVGVVRLVAVEPDGITLIVLAVLIEYLVRTEARLLEDGGYFDDGVFGYDFSEGYTSLESGAPKVRPYRERRSNGGGGGGRSYAASGGSPARRPRSGAWMRSSKNSTAKGGRALTDEENRFLVRVKHALSQPDKKHVNEPTSKARPARRFRACGRRT